MMMSWRWAAMMALAALCRAEESTETAPAEEKPEADETQQIIDQLTIDMVSDVADARTLVLRKTAKEGVKHIRLGNVALPERGEISEEQHAEKLEEGKAALLKLVEKQMIWWKAAPAEAQPKEKDEYGPELVISDAWLIDGRHINTLVRDEGHVSKSEEYHSDLARNILSADAAEKKKESYKELEEALKESQKHKAEMAKQAREAARKAEEEENVESIGFTGFIGLGFVILIIVGVFTNFGRETKKGKVNLNKKRGVFERFMMKLKGA